MTIYIEILESDSEIEKRILRAILEEFNNRVIAKLSTIKLKIADLVEQLIIATPTYESLISGELAGHFGLPAMNRAERVHSIVDTIKQNIDVSFQPIKLVGKKFKNGITIGVLLKRFIDVLNMSEAFVYTEKDQELPWLKWLLLAGDRIIISKHEVSFNSNSGRSGMAVMVQNKASVWRVPPQYAGNMKSNWLIRTFVDNQDAYLDGIGQILQNELQ